MFSQFLSLLPLLALIGRVQSACECGYLDPITGSLWTDATITYFNETGLADVVVDVESSPSIYGMGTSGLTGNGQQAWSLVGDQINKWEESFGATYRSAVSFNNTFINNQSQALSMQVSPADETNHIVNGSEMVTRRRDIMYGSFRTFILPTASYNLNGGSGFKFGVSYNNSETVDLTIFTSNLGNNNHTLSWSYSATGKDASPLQLNLSSVDPNGNVQAGLEHRIDWTNDRMISIGNSGSNDSANMVSYIKGENATNLPSTPAPVSFQTWSNGEPSASMGPPRLHPAITDILYTRFFFNSTLSQRSLQFIQECQASSSLSDAVCSTDDYTLRNSTTFDFQSTLDVVIPKISFKVPLYAVIVESISLGFILLLVIHVFITRRFFGITSSQQQQHHVPPPLPMTSSDEKQVKEIHDTTLAGGTPSASQTVETLLLSRRNSSYSASHSNLGHGSSSLGHSKAGSSSRQSLHGFSTTTSRPPSFVAHQRHPRTRDITDLENMFDGWETDSEYDSDDFDHADRISGNFERYDDWDKEDQQQQEKEEYSPQVEILPEFVMSRPVSSSFQHDASAASTSSKEGPCEEKESSDSSSSPIPPPPPQIIQWQMRNPSTDGAHPTMNVQLAEPVALEDAQEIAREGAKSSMAHFPTLLHLIFKRIDSFLFVERTKLLTSTGQRRIDYLDGMRGAACLLVSLAHFTLIYYIGIANSGTPSHYPEFEKWYRYIWGAIGNNASLLLGFFFALPARTMCQRYLTRGGLATMADTTVRRIPRLMLPVASAATIEYFLMDVNAFKWVQRLSSRTWSVWSYWQNYDNCLVFVNAVITLPFGTPPASPALVTGYATGVLWTIPVIIQGMWTCMIASLIAHEIKSTWKRFSFYFLAVLFSWYANTWDCYFLTGLIVGDLDVNLRYRELAAKGIPLLPIPGRKKWVRLHGRWLVWTFFLACCAEQWLTWVSTSPLGGFTNVEHAIHPDWQTSLPYVWEGQVGYSGYTNPQIFGFFMIFGLFMIADHSEAVQKFFRLRIWHFLGVHSMSVYLLHGIVWWTWSAWVVMTMLTSGAPYWAATLVAVITGYALLFVMCICFTYTFEVWATLFAKAVWRATSGKMGRKV